MLARIQATDQRFDGADGSVPDGLLRPAEVSAVFLPSRGQTETLRMQLLATYFNLATRRSTQARQSSRERPASSADDDQGRGALPCR